MLALDLAAIRSCPDDDAPWKALDSWLSDNGEYRAAAAVAMFWCVLRDGMAEGQDVTEGLEFFRRHAVRLARHARQIEREQEERRILDPD
jgi:hypothetical protein